MRERIRACLLGTPPDLVAAQATRGDFDLNPALRPFARRQHELQPAAVLVPLVERPDGMAVLLTRRTEHLARHAGQIAFPGGRVEEGDRDALAAALRETEEEIGLERRFIEVAGYLDTYETGTGFHITPVVGFVGPGFTLRLDPQEVAAVFEVPLAFLLDPANHQQHSRVWQGRERRYYAMPYGEHYIWGATAGMLMDLYRRMYG